MAKLYIGNTAYKVMLGNNSAHFADLPTVVWNQFIQNGDFSQGTTGWRISGEVEGTLSAANNKLTFTANGSVSGKTRISGPSDNYNAHKVYITVTVTSSKSTQIIFQHSGVNIYKNVTANTKTVLSSIGQNTGQDLLIYPDRTGAFTSGDTCVIENVCGFDLTLMFGAGNEPTSVEQFEQWFTDNIGSLETYYQYNEGKEIEVKYLPKNMQLI